MKQIDKVNSCKTHKFYTWLHSYFLEQFGQKVNSCKTHSAKKAKQRIRTPAPEEKQCKAARKALIKAGLKASLEEESRYHKNMALLNLQAQQIAACTH